MDTSKKNPSSTTGSNFKETPRYSITLSEAKETPFLFVLSALTDIFGKTRAEAVDLAFLLENNLVVEVGLYNWEVARHLNALTMSYCKYNGYSLKCKWMRANQ